MSASTHRHTKLLNRYLSFLCFCLCYYNVRDMNILGCLNAILSYLNRMAHMRMLCVRIGCANLSICIDIYMCERVDVYEFVCMWARALACVYFMC